MQLDYLKYIIAVKQYGSINKAAEKLYISQQYISKVLKTMEHESGKTLFVRSNHGVELTVDGEKVYQFAMKYTQMRNTLDEELTLRYLRDIKGNLRIGAVNTASAMVLPQILCRYYHDYPNIKIEVIAGDTDEMLEMLLQNEIDLAIIINAQIKGEEYLKIPRTWEASSIGRFMLWMGPISSIFDIMTYVLMFYFIAPIMAGGSYQSLTNPDYFIAVFQTGWFIESMWSQILVIHVIRTAKVPFIQSKPALFVTIFTLLSAFVLTLIPFSHLAKAIGLTSLPAYYFGLLIIIVILYIALTTVVKRVYLNKYHEWL